MVFGFDYNIGGVRVLTDKKIPFAGGETVCIDSSRIDDCLEVIKNRGITSIAIMGKEYHLDDIGFLNKIDLSLINSVSISVAINDLSPLYNVRHLTALSLSYGLNYGNINLDNFKKLEYLNLEWDKKRVNGLENCLNLKYLEVSKFSESDLTRIGKLSELKIIKLHNGKMSSLFGIENLSDLSHIEITKAKFLQDITAINEQHKNRLKKLFIYNAPQLCNIKPIIQQSQLEMLQLVEIGEVDSIKFVNEFKNLQLFGFNARVKDGDKTPLERFS